MKTETKQNLLGSALLLLGGYLITNSKHGLPSKISVIKPFDKDRFLGKWYEIARLDHAFECNLTNVTALYTQKGNSKMEVIHRAYDEFNFDWKTQSGKVKFKDDEHRGALKVSFYDKSSIGFNVIEVDPEYQYMLVSGDSLDTLWILSRSAEIPSNIKEEFLSKAKKLGFKTSNLIWVEHNEE